MRWSVVLLAAFHSVACLSAAPTGDRPEDYLTRDGQLKGRLEVLELQGGFAGFTGTYSAIEPDGSWSIGPVLRGEAKGEPRAKGKLTAEQLAGLAQELARQRLAELPDHGAPVVNPRVVKIRFGDKVSELQPERGQSPPADDQAIRARYRAIADAVKALCKN